MNQREVSRPRPQPGNRLRVECWKLGGLRAACGLFGRKALCRAQLVWMASWEEVAPARFSSEGVLPIPTERKGAEFFRLKPAK